MPSAETQTIEGAGRPDAAAGADPAAQRTRRLLRAVERYKAVCLARGETPDDAESWRVLLAALSVEDGAGDPRYP
jgi:hypothetical protein